VDHRPLGKDGVWLLNASAAVIRLDVPLIKSDIESDLVTCIGRTPTRCKAIRILSCLR